MEQISKGVADGAVRDDGRPRNAEAPRAALRWPQQAAELWRVPLAWECEPQAVLAALAGRDGLCCLTGAWADGSTIIASEPLGVAERGDPFALLDRLPRVEGGSPAPGVVGGGWFGWLGYRLAARIEAVALAASRPVSLPEFHLAYHDNVLRRDRGGEWWFEALATSSRRGELEQRLECMRHEVTRSIETRRGGVMTIAPGPLRLSAEAAERHLAAVAACRERIAAGEIFQANICLRLEAEYSGRATALLHEALGRGALSQYTAAFDTAAGGICSLSPELFLRRRGRDVRSAPIKGTAPRPEGEAASARALAGLRGSAKDAAEHVMIVDLMRNDIGRVCEYGSVRAARWPRAEAHPGLWHLVTDVTGHLREGVGDGELVRACFPPGSVTGAPKVQSLRVIAELESSGREVYTGAIGYASPLAGLELNVAIRTLELARGRLWLGVGGGITAGSDPRSELAEALVKAQPVGAAIGTSVTYHGWA